jgi:F-type H+-transporting ATPase subunit alpha
MLRNLLQDVGAAVKSALAEARPALVVQEIGVVTGVGGGIARVRGLPGLMSEELVELGGNAVGIAINLEPDEAGVVLLTPASALAAGSEARSTGRLADTPVGDELMGRVIDAMGKALDSGKPIRATKRALVDTVAPAIMERAPVEVPLQTGLKVVDALIPIGRGQRELIVGDRQTGKTTIAVDTILNQADSGVTCIYCAIGQRGTAVAQVVNTLRTAGALAYTVVVVAAGEDPPGLQYITPFAAMAIGEHFMRQGRDVLVVFDDLTRHARAYRELSLLLRRPPGREAYPGDIFYLHARLLERATHLRKEAGGGSLTAMPIIETQAQDISAYIPTNLISITDGQIYMSPDLFHKGALPAVDVGRSVSRIGGKAQLPAYRGVAGRLRLAYSQFEELETFARFATRLDDRTRAVIERGRRVREALRQREHAPMSPAEQIAVLRAVAGGLFDSLAIEEIADAEVAIRQALRECCGELACSIHAGARIDDRSWEGLDAASRAAVSGLRRAEAG